MSSDPFDVLTSALADRYTIERELGRGGAAAVFLAEDLRHHRKVALKILRPEVAQAVGSERFLREIEVAAGLAHPHIVPLYDSGDASGVLYFVMPFVEGESLRERLDREGALPVDEAVRIARELADALGHAHAHGVVHRDVKPENVLLEAGHALLADFGVARAVRGTEDQRLTKTGIAVGTPAYMSPEQAAGDDQVDGRSDQYALGCLLYEMLTGLAPYSGPSSESVIRQHLAGTPTPVTQLRPSVPRGVAAALERAMAKVPADRFGCMEAFTAALDRADEPSISPSEPSRGSRSVPRWVLVTGSLTVAVLLTTPVLRPNTERTPPSVLVMPAEVSGAAELELAQGITKAVYRKLVPVRGLSVKAPYDRRIFDDTGMTWEQIGAEFDVDYVLKLTLSTTEGTGGPVMVVAPELIRTSTGVLVWSESVEAGGGSVSELQAMIAQAVVEELDVHVSAPERAALRSVPTTSDSAWLLYQEAHRVNTSGPSWASRAAIPIYHRAIAADSGLVDAYLGLSNAYSAVGQMDSAQAAFLAAQGLAPEHPDLGLAEGGLAYGRGQYEQAARIWGELLEERPSDADLRHNLGIAMRLLGRWEEARAYLTRAWELDESHVNNHWVLSNTLRVLRDYDRAEYHLDCWDDLTKEGRIPGNRMRLAWDRAWLRLAADGDIQGARREIETLAGEFGREIVLQGAIWVDVSHPMLRLLGEPWVEDFRQGRWEALGAQQIQRGLQANVYVARANLADVQGSRDLAVLYYDSALIALESLRPWSPGMFGVAAVATSGLGRVDEAVDLAEQGLRLRPVEGTRDGWVNLWYLARTLIVGGEYDRAVEVLDSLLAVPSDYSRTWMRINPFFDRLRDHAGFQALVAEN